MKFSKAVDDYLNSKTYNSLSYNTIRGYKYNLNRITSDKVYGLSLIHI